MLKNLLSRIRYRNVAGATLEKHQKIPEVYRIRKGNERVMFRISAANKIYILATEKLIDTPSAP